MLPWVVQLEACWSSPSLASSSTWRSRKGTRTRTTEQVNHRYSATQILGGRTMHPHMLFMDFPMGMVRLWATRPFASTCNLLYRVLQKDRLSLVTLLWLPARLSSRQLEHPIILLFSRYTCEHNY